MNKLKKQVEDLQKRIAELKELYIKQKAKGEINWQIQNVDLPSANLRLYTIQERDKLWQEAIEDYNIRTTLVTDTGKIKQFVCEELINLPNVEEGSHITN